MRAELQLGGATLQSVGLHGAPAQCRRRGLVQACRPPVDLASDALHAQLAARVPELQFIQRQVQHTHPIPRQLHEAAGAAARFQCAKFGSGQRQLQQARIGGGKLQRHDLQLGAVDQPCRAPGQRGAATGLHEAGLRNRDRGKVSARGRQSSFGAHQQRLLRQIDQHRTCQCLAAQATKR